MPVNLIAICTVFINKFNSESKYKPTHFTVKLNVMFTVKFIRREFDDQLPTTQWPSVFRLKFLNMKMTHFIINLTINNAFCSAFNRKIKHFTANSTVILHLNLFTFW